MKRRIFLEDLIKNKDFEPGLALHRLIGPDLGQMDGQVLVALVGQVDAIG